MLALAGLVLGLILLAPVSLGAEPIRVSFEYARTALVFATADHAAPPMAYQARLRLIIRPAGDSDNTVLRGISPLFSDAVESALKRDGMLIAATDQDAADAIASGPGAIGTTTLALIVGEKRPLTALALDGVTPSLETIASGAYPHTKTIHVITRHQEPRPAVVAFVRSLRTPAARAIVTGTGFLALPAGPRP